MLKEADMGQREASTTEGEAEQAAQQGSRGKGRRIYVRVRGTKTMILDNNLAHSAA